MAGYSIRKLRLIQQQYQQSDEELSNVYNGPVAKVRRDSDSTEALLYCNELGVPVAIYDLTLTLNSTVYTDMLSGWSTGQIYVVTWYDQSGAGRDLQQASQTMQPSIKIFSQLGYPQMSVESGKGFSVNLNLALGDFSVQVAGDFGPSQSG